MAIDAASNTVKANFGFYNPPEDGSLPVAYVADYSRNYSNVYHEVTVENVRGKEDQFSLDTTGFQFLNSPANYKAFRDDDEVKAEYYPESIELIKKQTGASRVVIFDHTIRRRVPGQKGEDPKSRQPADVVHGDQTPNGAIARVHVHMPADEAPELLKKRFQIINLWRPISHTALDWPLALCDYYSVDVKQDTQPITLAYPDRNGEVYGIKYNPNFQWKYLRGMTPDEAILIKCYDSIQDGSVAVFTPHTAFADPTTPPDAPLRQSIDSHGGNLQVPSSFGRVLFYLLYNFTLAKKVTGASRVVIFDQTLRRRRPGWNGDDTIQALQPAAEVHGDQTPNGATNRVHLHMSAEEAPELLKKRFQIINIWRPISHPALDWPLALCDYGSVDVEKDALPVTLVRPDRNGEIYGFSYNPDHQWKYVRGMTPDEVVLIKCQDSVRDGSVAVFTPHCAFVDPTTPRDTPPRESIEMRALVFYD
ncbi:hypothetical protein NMY22_g9102 [Coprinellus aureogranulatus]|nr:hypothetical protein NMY22_g9102 [Coprinellus aureogranulatus]